MHFLTVSCSLVRKYTARWYIFQRFEIWALLHEMNEFAVISEKSSPSRTALFPGIVASLVVYVPICHHASLPFPTDK